MAGPCGVLSISPAATTTEGGDVDGWPPGVLPYLWKWPPPKLGMSTAGPLTSMVICSEFCKKDVGSNK
jgi:hypothetical protein